VPGGSHIGEPLLVTGGSHIGEPLLVPGGSRSSGSGVAQSRTLSKFLLLL